MPAEVWNILKLIYVVIDGMGDRPIPELKNKTPLEFAETPNMDFLAKNGKTGLMYPVKKGIAPESDIATMAILGYDPLQYSSGRGILEAVGADMDVKDGDLALRCNFATLGDGEKIIDRRAGRDLTTEEAEELSEAINKNVKLESHPANFEFKNTIGHRGVLVIKGRNTKLSSKITNTDPAYSKMQELGVAEHKFEMALKKCEPLEDSEEAKISAELVNEFIAKSHMVLDGHKVNKKRAAEGKLKANIILTRDAGHLLPKFFKINEKYGVSFVSLTDMPVERGISKLTGMDVITLPPPSRDLKNDCIIRVNKLLELLTFYDCFYIHIKGPDEPSHDGKFDVKAQLISLIDKYFFGEILKAISLENYVICATADHATPCKLKAHSDDPVPLLISGDKIQGDGIPKFSESECRRGSLGVLEHGTLLMPQLISLIKANLPGMHA
ncbi:MAG: alkaline phosphatase family protein [Candidatus Bathyarchaeia archaeon]